MFQFTTVRFPRSTFNVDITPTGEPQAYHQYLERKCMLLFLKGDVSCIKVPRDISFGEKKHRVMHIHIMIYMIYIGHINLWRCFAFVNPKK